MHNLKPGQSITLSASNGIRVLAERTGCGKWLRIVREHRDGFEVVSTHLYCGAL